MPRRGLIWYVLLVVANALLVVGIINVWWGEDSQPAGRSAQHGPQVPKVPTLRDNQPLEAFQVIAARSLFVPDRRGPEAGPAQKGQAGLEGSRLMGVIIVGQDKAALIMRSGPAPGAAGQVEIVHLGEQLGPDQVVDISSDTVTIQGKSGKKTLTFPE